MEVILLERIGKLGQMGDVVRVKDGYARNFLLPQNKALRATKANMQHFEKQRAQLEARNLEAKKEASAVAEKVNGESYVIIRQAGETGQLYGSVSSRDISDLVTEGGCSIERRQVVLSSPIKVLGVHEVAILLHPEVEAIVKINVARTEEEAERQGRGEDVTASRQEEEDEGGDAISAEEVFEDETLAQEARMELEDSEAADDSADSETAQAEGGEEEKAG